MNWINNVTEGVNALGEHMMHFDERLKAVEQWIVTHIDGRLKAVEQWRDETKAAEAGDDAEPEAPTVHQSRCAQEHSIADLEAARVAAQSAAGDAVLAVVQEMGPKHGSLEAAKAAARAAVAEPEAPPEAGQLPNGIRSPLDMIQAILSNLSLVIDSENHKEAVRHAQQAQRWALILKKELAKK